MRKLYIVTTNGRCQRAFTDEAQAMKLVDQLNVNPCGFVYVLETVPLDDSSTSESGLLVQGIGSRR